MYYSPTNRDSKRFQNVLNTLGHTLSEFTQSIDAWHALCDLEFTCLLSSCHNEPGLFDSGLGAGKCRSDFDFVFAVFVSVFVSLLINEAIIGLS